MKQERTSEPLKNQHVTVKRKIKKTINKARGKNKTKKRKASHEKRQKKRTERTSWKAQVFKRVNDAGDAENLEAPDPDVTDDQPLASL